MAIPSSPPLLPETELPSSPPLLPQPAFLPLVSNIRKRQLPEDENSLSSDPLFSEDPSEAEDLALYGNPRRKKMIKGPWWTPASSKSEAEYREGLGTKKETFRNMDSGVFMGSDVSSEMSIDTPDRALPARRNHRRMRRSPGQPYRAVAKPIIAQAQPEADKIINEVVDAGKESFDLSGLGLDSLSAATLAPIRHLTRQLHINLAHAPSEEEFKSLTPEIKLFLAHNELCRVPAELFNLQHLIALSLRNNNLVELPHSIGRLHKLSELNIAGNNISWLPWELLDFLADHKQITLRPNPLLQPTGIATPSASATLPAPSEILRQQIDDADDTYLILGLLRNHYEQHGSLDIRAELEMRLTVGRVMLKRFTPISTKKSDVCRKQLIFLAPSKIRYFEVTGRPCQQLPADWNYPVNLNLEPSANDAYNIAPSLFECALQSAQRAFYLDNLPAELPEVIEQGLRAAADAVHYGNPECSTCGRRFVIARAEWVEYWFRGSAAQRELTPEMVLPFRRQACSWHCARPSPIGTFRC